LVALIFHTMFNYSAQIFSILETQQGGLFYLILFISIVIAVVAITGPKRLVREKSIKYPQRTT